MNHYNTMLSKEIQFHLDVANDERSQTCKLSAFLFPGSLPLPGVPGCPLYKPAPPQCSPQLSKSSSLFSGPSRRTAAKVPYLATQRSVDTLACLTECSCCCCNEDLMKLQVSCLYSSQLSFTCRKIPIKRLPVQRIFVRKTFGDFPRWALLSEEILCF